MIDHDPELHRQAHEILLRIELTRAEAEDPGMHAFLDALKDAMHQHLAVMAPPPPPEDPK